MSRPQKVNGAIFHLPIMEGNIRSALKMITFDRGAQLQKTTEANGEIAKVKDAYLFPRFALKDGSPFTFLLI